MLFKPLQHVQQRHVAVCSEQLSCVSWEANNSWRWWCVVECRGDESSDLNSYLTRVEGGRQWRAVEVDVSLRQVRVGSSSERPSRKWRGRARKSSAVTAVLLRLASSVMQWQVDGIASDGRMAARAQK